MLTCPHTPNLPQSSCEAPVSLRLSPQQSVVGLSVPSNEAGACDDDARSGTSCNVFGVFFVFSPPLVHVSIL